MEHEHDPAHGRARDFLKGAASSLGHDLANLDPSSGGASSATPHSDVHGQRAGAAHVPGRGASYRVTVKLFPYGLVEDLDPGSLDLFSSNGIGTATLIILGGLTIAGLVSLFGAKHSEMLLPLLVAAILIGNTIVIGGLVFRSSRRRKGKPNGFLPNIRTEKIIATLDGLKFATRLPGTRLSKLDVADHSYYSIDWDGLRSVSLTGDPDVYNSLKVTFEGRNGADDIALLAIHTKENWARLSDAIKHFAPHVEIDDEVGRALTLSSTNTSFTELWLEALTMPPSQDNLSPIRAGDKLLNGRYTIVGVLGVGGQGHAYEATDANAGLAVVLKEYLLPAYTSEIVRQKALQTVQSEISLLSRTSHPQIVQLIDSFVERSRAFLVFNKIEGINLRQQVEQNNRMPPQMVLALARQMVVILSYLHSFNPAIIHRDFTPDNLIIDSNGRLTLVDFTIAEPHGMLHGLPPAGKPAYMPPEQYGGDTIAQSDIYAMGCSLYFCLKGDDPEPLMQLCRPPNQAASREELALETIICRCTAQDFRDRFHSAGEIIKLIESLD